jgi:hypothetical protein
VHYAVLGNTRKLRELQTRNSELGDPFEQIARWCPSKDPGSALDSCLSSVEQQIDRATVALLAGDQADSDRRYADADRFAVEIRTHVNADNFRYVQSWHQARIRYFLYSGRLSEAVEQMKSYTAEAERYDPNSHRDYGLDDFAYASSPRQLARLTRMISDEDDLDGIILTYSLYRDFDAAVLKGEGPDALAARIQVIGELREKYAEAQDLWHNIMTLSLECRLALIHLARGDKAGAAQLYDRVFQIYMREPADPGWEVGLCLYRMAPQLGRAEDRERLLEVMRAHHAESRRGLNINYDNLIAGARSSPYVNIAADSIARYEVFREIALRVAAIPAGYTYLDRDRFTTAASEALQWTKDPRIQGNEVDELFMIADFALDRYLYVGE